MPRALKCWIGNYDGTRRGLVITTTKKRAIELARCGRAHFEGFWVERSEVPIAYFDIDVLYTIPFALVHQPGIESKPQLWTARPELSAPQSKKDVS